MTLDDIESVTLIADKKPETEDVFFMWDLFSKERLSGKRFSLEYPKDTVISMEGSLLSQRIVKEWNSEHDAWTSGFQCQGLFSEYTNVVRESGGDGTVELVGQAVSVYCSH